MGGGGVVHVEHEQGPASTRAMSMARIPQGVMPKSLPPAINASQTDSASAASIQSS